MDKIRANHIKSKFFENMYKPAQMHPTFHPTFRTRCWMECWIKKTTKISAKCICAIYPTSTCMFIHWQFKMAEADDFAIMILLNELMDSDDEKPKRGKTRKWVKRRKEGSFFTNIVEELVLQ